MHSSMTTVEPEAPNLWSCIMERTASSASSTVAATTTPLAQGKAVRLHHDGGPCART